MTSSLLDLSGKIDSLAVSAMDQIQQIALKEQVLFFIIRNYLDAGNLDRLFDEAPDLVAADDYDYELASARLQKG